MVPREVQAIFREAHSKEPRAEKQRGILYRIKGVYARNKTWFRILALVVAGVSVAAVARHYELSPDMRARLQETGQAIRDAPASARARIKQMLMTEENRQVEAYAKDPFHPNATLGPMPDTLSDDLPVSTNNRPNSKALVVYKPKPVTQSTALARIPNTSLRPPAPKTSPLRNPALPKVPTFPKSWRDFKDKEQMNAVFKNMDRYKTQLLRGVRDGTITRQTAERRITDLVPATYVGLKEQLKAINADFRVQMSLLNHKHRPTKYTKQLAHDAIRGYTTGRDWHGPRSHGWLGWYDGTNAREVFKRGGFKPGRAV